jgi:hypothetical protein
MLEELPPVRWLSPGQGLGYMGVISTHDHADRYARTGDPILTMDRRSSAVLTRVLAGRSAL